MNDLNVVTIALSDQSGKREDRMHRNARSTWSTMVGGVATLICAVLLVGVAGAQPAPNAIQSSIKHLLGNPPRVTHGQSATLLPNGQWLLLGGERTDAEPIATAALLDPHSGQARLLPNSMAKPRSGHTATLLPDGMVLIIGGFGENGELVSSAETFDPESATFQLAPGYNVQPRALHTATLLTDGRLLVVGGIGSDGAVLDDVEVFDTFSGALERFAAKLETARFGHLATLLPSAPALITGGVDRDD